MPEIVRRTCHLCEACCGVEVHVEGEKILAVRPTRPTPARRATSARRASRWPTCTTTPTACAGRCGARRRATSSRSPGTRRSPRRRAASRAIRARHGNDAVALYVGNPIVHNSSAALVRAGLLAAFGSRNCYSAGSQDTSPRFATSWYLYGSSFATPIPDLERTDYLLCVGANPLVSNGSLLTAPDVRGRLRALRARGGRLVVVDPRRTETAREADEHVAILPGGDAALLLGMLRVLLDEGRVDRAADRASWRGASTRSSAACARSTPAALAAAAGVSWRDDRAPRAGVRRRADERGLLAHRRLQQPLRHARHLGDGPPEPRRRAPRRAGRLDVHDARRRPEPALAAPGLRRPRPLAEPRARAARDPRRPAGGVPRRGDRDAGRGPGARAPHATPGTRCSRCRTAAASTARSRASSSWCRSTST